MLSDRLPELLNSGELTAEDLYSLLHECEENSNKRVRLLRAKRAHRKHPIFEATDPIAFYKKSGSWPAFGVRSVGATPSEPKVTEVRIEEARGQRALVVKVGMVDERRVLIDESQDANGNDVLVFGKRSVPAINVVRLFEDGLMEMRMHRDKDIEDYSGTASLITKLVSPLISIDHFVQHPVHDILDKLWDPKTREQLAEHMAIIRSKHKNGRQTKIEVTTGALVGGLITDPDTLDTMDRFHNSEGGPTVAACESVLLQTYITEKETLAGVRPVVVHIHGQKHEFSVPAKCRKADYDRALSQLIGAQRRRKSASRNGR
ncbi:MAG: hypothetical protein AAGD43_03255 [Pseudomonadota bacterium]